MVVSAPHIDDTIKATFKFIKVVSDIGGKVCKLTILASHNTVLLVAEIG